MIPWKLYKYIHRWEMRLICNKISRKSPQGLITANNERGKREIETEDVLFTRPPSKTFSI